MRNLLHTIVLRSQYLGVVIACICLSCRAAAPASAPPAPSAMNIQTRDIRDDAGELLVTETFYTDETGTDVKEGPEVHWYQPGKKHIEVPYHRGRIHGILREWSEGGKKTREEQFKDGFQDGPSTTWYTSGQLQSESLYKDGKIIGKKRSYSEAGKLRKEQVYDKTGTLSEVTTYYDNGQSKIHGYFGSQADTTKFLWGQAGNLNKNGTWTYWDEQGRVIAEGIFKDGQPWEGICGVSQRDSSFIRETWGRFHEGKLIEPVRDPMNEP
jgi:hypothetical protein